jgi:hypothetical protein
MRQDQGRIPMTMSVFVAGLQTVLLRSHNTSASLGWDLTPTVQPGTLHRVPVPVIKHSLAAGLHIEC